MSLKKVVLLLSLFSSLLLFSCENPIETEESDSGDCVLTLCANYDGGTSVSQRFNTNTLFKVKQNPFNRPGYTFVGWTDIEGSSFVLYNNRSEMAFRTDKTLYAVWQLQTYAVRYKVNGGKRTVLYPEEFTIQKGTTLNPVSNGKYTFGGWYASEDLSGDAVTEIPTGTIGDKTFYARWCSKITYHLQGGAFAAAKRTVTQATADENTDGDADLALDADVATDESAENAEDTAETDAVTVALAAESGEETSEDAVQQETLASIESDDETVAGSDESAEFALFETESEETIDAVQETADAEVAPVEDVAESEAESLIPAELFVADVAAELPLPADEPEKILAVSEAVDSEDGTVQYVTVGESVTLPIPVRDGYVFGGWYYDERYMRPVGSSRISCADATVDVYVKWNEIKTYAITYQLAGGTNAAENEATYQNSENPVLLAEPARYGYVFGGWYEDKTFVGDAVAEIAAYDIGDKTFWAKWERDTFTVTYCIGNATDGDVPPAKKAEYESKITIADNEKGLSLDGCEFLGWIVRLTPPDVSETDTAEVSDAENEAEELFVAAGKPYVVVGNVWLYPAWRLTRYMLPAAKKGEKGIAKDKLPSVVLPEAVYALGDGVFAGFSSLRSIDLTDITTIGSKAFAYDAFTTLDFSGVRSLGDAVCMGCTALQKIILPAVVPNQIGTGLFSYTTKHLIFIATEETRDSYKALLTETVVGRDFDSFTIVVPSDETAF